MSFITTAEALGASNAEYASFALAESAIRKSASAPPGEWFDVFLSHSFQDAKLIAGVAKILENDGFKVYIDWRDDPQLDRSRVTLATASILRDRMGCCRFLLYATSSNASSSRWMPWELGYFDGMRSGKVGILPVLDQARANYQGQEYLGLYPVYERVAFAVGGRRLGRRTGPTAGVTLASEVKS